MSTAPENEFDLEKLFLPAWAQEPAAGKYAKYEGVEERPGRREERRGPRPPRREGFGAGGRDTQRPRRDPRSGFKSQDRERARGPAGERPPFRREEERREPPPPLPDINLSLVPDEKGVESLARQIKMTGRAYPLFGIAQMILQKPERHSVAFGVKKNAEGQPIQPLFVCALDDTLWLSEAEAIDHVLKKHFATFYQAERTATEPPKGKYTFVAQCGMSGIILGPPNHHDYQNQLRKLHAERFSRVPFDAYKSRVKIVRDEAVVKKWIEDQSWRTEYLCLNLPEQIRLGNLEAVTQHFRENHKDNIIKQVENHTLSGAAARSLRSSGLVRLVRNVWEDQRRFPLQIATVLSQQFASHGLQFFKVNKTVTHVSVARPHYLDLSATPVSEGVKRIVDYINANPKCTRRQLVETLAPSAKVPPPATPSGEGQTTTPVESPEPTPEQTAVVADLHWLIHQGHVIEFANGLLETAKKPAPKPPKPEPKLPAKSAEPAVQTEPVAGGGDVSKESTETGEAPVDEPVTDLTASAAVEQPSLEPATLESSPVEQTNHSQAPLVVNPAGVDAEPLVAPSQHPS